MPLARMARYQPVIILDTIMYARSEFRNSHGLKQGDQDPIIWIDGRGGGPRGISGGGNSGSPSSIINASVQTSALTFESEIKTKVALPFSAGIFRCDSKLPARKVLYCICT